MASASAGVVRVSEGLTLSCVPSADSTKKGVSTEDSQSTLAWLLGIPRPHVSLCPQGMRVVNIVGFRRGYNFLNELLALAKPFGRVVKHLVLDLRAEVELLSLACPPPRFHGNLLFSAGVPPV